MTATQQQQRGFTLIELVMVIVVIGILAAVALPRFANTATDARVASLNGLAGGLRSAVGIVQAAYVTAGSSGTSVTMMNGVTVAVGSGTSAGLPTAAATGIGAAMQDLSSFVATYGATTATFSLPSGQTNCQVTYNGTTGQIAVTTTGC